MAVVIEKINEINGVIKEIFDYTQSDTTIKSDFDDYISTIGERNISLNNMEKIFLPYIFERRIGKSSASIIELFLKNQKTENIEIAKSLLDAQSSIYEIKRILKHGMIIYNLVNEKIYTVLSLTKMSSFKNIFVGQYIVARIFESEGEHYIIEISSVLSASQETDAVRYAVMKLVQSPQLLYLDNKQKEEQVVLSVKNMYKNFMQIFNSDIILTTNKYADEIIGAFNDGEKIDLSDKLCNLDKYKFFHVKELDNNYSNFLENSLGGFSSHNTIYDVAIIFDKDKGLYTIPFYQTFVKIFKGEKIEGAKECIEYFMHNESVPDVVIKRVANECPDFIQTINKMFKADYTFEDLIKEYKSDYLEHTIYSPATVLYCSTAFTKMYDIITAEKKEQKVFEKVGRNEACPCGSGKKYKNCCGKNV